jgi:nicotinate-nucleotide adenylyltransferase
MPKERIGLLGGTFNPVHRGHIRAAKTVAGSFKLDKILFMPAYMPPHKEKEGIAEAKHRWVMVKEAVAPYPRLVPSSLEIDMGGPSYSINTIRKIKQKFQVDRLFFILGVDAFLEIETWKNYREVLKSCDFIVLSRPGYHLREAAGILNGRYKEKMTYVEETAKIDIKTCGKFKFFLFEMNSLDISSSEIRIRLKQGESITGLVPLKVEKYIKENNLYL